MIQHDAECYRFHESDASGRCFACGREPSRLVIVRHVATMMLVHLCPDCMAVRISDYLLDNTRPWRGSKGQIE